MDSYGFKTIAYAYDVAVVISGIHLDMLSQRMQATLKVIGSWSINSGLSANPSKTELELFQEGTKFQT